MLPTGLREKAERFRRVQAQYERTRRRRAADLFEEALRELMGRVESPRRNPAAARRPVAPEAPESGRPEFDQFVRDLLVRVHGRGPIRSHDESAWWSPEYVFGYRAWELSGELWHGARRPWPEPVLEAECLGGGGSGAVPHDAAECLPPPCGIYAMAEAEPVAGMAVGSTARSGGTLAVGTVAMSGRVIEHESGFRAQRAEVVAVSLLSRVGDRLELRSTTSPEAIRALFADPRSVLAQHRPTVVDRAEAKSSIVGFLTANRASPARA